MFRCCTGVFKMGMAELMFTSKHCVFLTFYSNSSAVVNNLVCAGNVDLNEEDLKGVLMKFWEVDTLSGDLNAIVQEQFDTKIYFNGVRYVTSLPFQTDVKFVPDNHQIS